MAIGSRRGAVDWRQATRYLDAEVKRVAALLRSVRHPDAPALGSWSVRDVAVHLSQAWIAVPGLAREDLGEWYQLMPGLRDGNQRSVVRDIWNLGDVTRGGVDAEPERDLSVLAARIEQRAAAFLGGIRGSASDLRPWLVEGTQVALATLTCHLLNETVVHGWDVATSDGQRWDIPAAHAATALDGFIIPVLQALGPRDMVDQEVAAGLQATFEVKVKGAARHLFVFDDGALAIDPPSPPPVDCTITADPVAMLLVVWGRMEQAKAIVQRKLITSGPKDWLGPRLRSLMRNP